LYQNNGYLFSNINPVEVKTANDSIDFEIRISEGPIAYFNKISVVGNDKTNDEVIYRELRTKPGQKYSKDELVRTIREIGQMGFFDPESIKPDFKNVDAAAGTVDIQYNLVEKGASQIELQGGYGGSGFIGTLGLSFNNFSVRNMFKKRLINLYLWVMVKKYLYVYKQVPITEPTVCLFQNLGLVVKNQFNLVVQFQVVNNTFIQVDIQQIKAKVLI